ncbi:MAG: hypothetical protein G01um10143_6 [Parcubacteria group bacterium Gr01-1014_3]|nr:MAG: hypothetical protein G01um10143_6 [Parcubacteria group bacterium Gr01-1014_3]
MSYRRVDDKEQAKIIELRKTGHSIPEISRAVNRSKSVIFLYVKGVAILPEFQSIYKAKQGASQQRSKRLWEDAKKQARHLINRVTARDAILLAASLYWGEGTKKDFSFINSDPDMIKVFVKTLEILGIEKKRLKITLRIYEDLNSNVVSRFWASVLDISEKMISNINILHGKKSGKLKYGMCRIRVTKGGPYLKLLQSAIDIIKSDITPS